MCRRWKVLSDAALKPVGLHPCASHTPGRDPGPSSSPTPTLAPALTLPLALALALAPALALALLWLQPHHPLPPPRP